MLVGLFAGLAAAQSCVAQTLTQTSSLDASKKPRVSNEEIIVTGRHLKPKKIAQRDFEPIVHLMSVRKEAKRVQLVSLMLSGLDGITTARCVASGTCVEMNPLLGKIPSPAKILGLKALIGEQQLRHNSNLADKDPFSARSHAYVSLVMNAVITASTMGTGI